MIKKREVTEKSKIPVSVNQLRMVFDFEKRNYNTMIKIFIEETEIISAHDASNYCRYSEEQLRSTCQAIKRNKILTSISLNILQQLAPRFEINSAKYEDTCEPVFRSLLYYAIRNRIMAYFRRVGQCLPAPTILEASAKIDLKENPESVNSLINPNLLNIFAGLVN